MTEQLPAVAAQNGPLLRALQAGTATSPGELAALADIGQNNIARKLASLAEAGLIEGGGEAGQPGYGGTLTDVGARALEALNYFADASAHGAALPTLAELPMVGPDLIDANPFDPRIVVDPVADAEMARSVADKGILQRILVRPHPVDAGRYQQALGHRRVRGARAAGVLVPIEVRDLTDDDMAEIAAIENLQRSDLHWMDEAEAYLRLADRGKSAAQIVALVGAGGRKKRSVQEMIQFAKELDDDAKARARLPDTEAGRAAGRITVDQARAMVGNKRAKPALDLTPKMKIALLELLLAGDCAMGEVGDVIKTVLHNRPVGGPMITLSDRGLVKWKFAGNDPVAEIEITDEIAKYLAECGYDDDPVEAVTKARADLIGELAAGSLAMDARYLSPELNPVERDPPPAKLGDSAADDQPSPLDAPAEEGEIRRDEHGDDYQMLAGTWEIYRAPPPATVLPTVTDDQALVILELAHKIGREAEPGADLPSARVDPSYRLDAIPNELVHARLIMFQIQGAFTAVALTPTAQAWLDSRDIARDEAGRPAISDEALTYIQAADGRETRGGYITPWLTVKPPLAAGEAAHGVRDDAAPPRRDKFIQDVLDTGDDADGDALVVPVLVHAPIERDTLTRLMAAAREAHVLVGKGQGRRLKPDEVKPVLALLDAALDAADRALIATIMVADEEEAAEAEALEAEAERLADDGAAQ